MGRVSSFLMIIDAERDPPGCIPWKVGRTEFADEFMGKTRVFKSQLCD